MKFATCFTTCVVIFAGFAALAGAADARQVYVPGFYRPNGIWVPPHYRTVPDGTAYDGAVESGVNPYTGQTLVNPYTGQVAPNPYPYGNPYQSPYQAPYQAPYVPPPASVPYYGAP
ncbi:MAG TPA: hypothetical protein VH189_14355 [Rhizomicrobium sp.]|jgi:hypothetical protein|nr:hypothetical protein [Rhizomicrobium sp.]